MSDPGRRCATPFRGPEWRATGGWWRPNERARERKLGLTLLAWQGTLRPSYRDPEGRALCLCAFWCRKRFRLRENPGSRVHCPIVRTLHSPGFRLKTHFTQPESITKYTTYTSLLYVRSFLVTSTHLAMRKHHWTLIFAPMKGVLGARHRGRPLLKAPLPLGICTHCAVRPTRRC